MHALIYASRTVPEWDCMLGCYNLFARMVISQVWGSWGLGTRYTEFTGDVSGVPGAKLILYGNARNS